LKYAREHPAAREAVAVEEGQLVSKPTDKSMPNIEVRATSIEADIEVVHGSLARTIVECVTHFIDRFREGVVSVELQSMPRAVPQDELAAVIDRLERVRAEVVASDRGIRSTTVASTSPAVEGIDINQPGETATLSGDVISFEQKVARELILDSQVHLLNVRRLQVLIHVAR